jgi:membrane protease YdiL (CAAX protease family)
VPRLRDASLPVRRIAGRAVQDSAYLIASSLCIFIPVLFIILKSGEKPSRFGLRKYDGATDVILVLVLIFCSYMLYVLTWSLVRQLGAGEETLHVVARPQSVLDWAFVVPALIANSFAEEITMRSYLITRMKVFVKSNVAVVIVCALLFASYHTYQGVGGTFGALSTGLVYGGVFCVFRRLWPLVIAHTVYNIMAFS